MRTLPGEERGVRKAIMKMRMLLTAFIGMAALGLILSGGIDAWAEDARSIEMSDMVVTASRAEEDIAAVSANVTVIDAVDIAASGAISVVDVLRDVAGVTIGDWTGTGRMANVDLRGFGENAAANTLVIVDGRRINPPDQSGIDWTVIPLDRIDRIEVIRGGGAVLYGNNATGGVINIITRKGAENHTAFGSTAVGSYDYYKQSVGVAGGTERLAYSLHGNYMETDGYRDNGDLRSKSAGLNLGFMEQWYTIDLSAGIKDDGYGLPGGIIEGQQRRRSTNTPSDWAESRDQYVQITPAFLFTGNSEFLIALNARKFEYNGESWGLIREYDLYDYGISPQYNTRFEMFGMPHNLVAGVDYQYSNLKSDWSDNTRSEVGIFVHDKVMLFEKLYVNVGYRGTRVDYDIDNGTDEDSTIHAATAGVTYNYGPGSKIFISAERGFRTVLLDELGGEGFDEILDPQISYHYQTGITHRSPLTEIGATFFHIDTKDEILFNPALPSFFGGQNDNYRRTRRQGIELEVAVIPHEKLRLFSNYTLMISELRGGEFDGNDIPGVPRHSAVAGATVFPISGVSLDARARWVEGKTMISDWENEIADDWEGGDYFVVDLKLGYSWRFLTLNTGVNNVFNTEYSEYGTYYGGGVRNIYPSPKRNYFSEIRLAYEF